MSAGFTPLVILGAARSGTNMLRDALTALPGFATWPCDEINPIWRHGNLRWPDDEIPPERAVGRPLSYIRRAFARLARRSGAAVVVEKTCANTLRVPFVAAVLPEARFVHIVRDGRDVVPSAVRRWRGGAGTPGLGYRLAKARFAPLADLPAHAAMHLRNRLALRRCNRMAVWGPRFRGMAGMVAAGAPLEEICATQWARSVDAADAALAAMAPERWLAIRYEDFTARPADGLVRIAALVGAEAPDPARAAQAVRPAAASGWEPDARIAAILASARARHGYGDAR